MMAKDLLSKLKAERVDGRCVRNNFSDHDQWVNVENIEDILKQEEIELNQNQEIVLEWLRERVNDNGTPILTLTAFGWKHFGAELPDDVEKAYQEMTAIEDYQLLAEFAKWGLGEVEK